MPSGTTAQDSTWKSREQGEEAKYIREKEQAQLAALREEQEKHSTNNSTKDAASSTKDHDFEGGFGGQEDLEDRYATTSGEH
ncbi:hypothetical protein BDR04DRAFT_1090720 [Suillus decipiens]|nr:hypothetical protein BDR04DRAFT_1090720 [Suillus decipiens]